MEDEVGTKRTELERELDLYFKIQTTRILGLARKIRTVDAVCTLLDLMRQYAAFQPAATKRIGTARRKASV